MVDQQNIRQTVQGLTTSSSAAPRYEWADVILMPINPNVLPIAEPIEKALADLGLSCRYLWATSPEDSCEHWRSMIDISKWVEMTVPVSWCASSLDYTVQMVQGLREVLRYDLRRKFGVFASFIDVGWAPRLLSVACRRQNVPSVLIQEGMTLQNNNGEKTPSPRAIMKGAARWFRELVAPQLFRDAEDGLYMQYACVFGPLKAASLMAQGKRREQIFVTGNPLFDSLTPKRIDAQPRSRTILYAHQILERDLDAEVVWWRALVKASQDMNANLIFKIHPRSGFSVARVREMLGISDDGSVNVISDGDIQDMVTQAGAFVTACSSSAYRAMAEGVPVVVLEGVPSRYRIDLAGYKAALPVHTLYELPQVLRMALDNAQIRHDLQKGVDVAIVQHLYRLDGQASRRVARVLASLLP